MTHDTKLPCHEDCIAVPVGGDATRNEAVNEEEDLPPEFILPIVEMDKRHQAKPSVAALAVFVEQDQYNQGQQTRQHQDATLTGVFGAACGVHRRDINGDGGGLGGGFARKLLMLAAFCIPEESFADLARKHFPGRRSRFISGATLSADHIGQCMIGFLFSLLLTAIGVVIFAFALPFSLAMACADVVVKIMSAPVLAYVVPLAFLTSPRFGPNIKIMSGILFPVTMLLGMLLFAAITPVIAVVVTLTIGIANAFGSEHSIMTTPIHCAAVAIDIVFNSPQVHAYYGTRMAGWQQPLAPNEVPFDIPLVKALWSLVVVFGGGMTGLVVMTFTALFCSLGGLLATYKTIYRIVYKDIKLACMLLPITALVISAGPPLIMTACIIAGPMMGLFSGGRALCKIAREPQAISCAEYFPYWFNLLKKDVKNFVHFTWESIRNQQ